MESASTTSNTPTPSCDCGNPNGHKLTCAVVRAAEAALPVEAPAKAIARKLLSIAALKKLLAEQESALRAQALALLPDPGDRAAVTLDDGSKLGNVRTDPGAAGGWRVTDAGALRAWVAEHVPHLLVDEVRSVVSPAYVEELLEQLAAAPNDGTWVEPETGEELTAPPPGIAYVPAGKPTLKVTPDRAAPAALRTILGAPALQQLGIEA